MTIATAPGKLIVSGEYAVLDGAPALVVAMDRRAVARCGEPQPQQSAFLVALAGELDRHGAPDAAAIARTISVDSTAFYDGAMKLGFGSSAAVTVAATALALSVSAARAGTTGTTASALTLTAPTVPTAIDRARVLAIAAAAHAAAQGARGARGSGADIAAAVHGGTLAFTASADDATPPRVARRHWPAALRLVPFFTGMAADTATLVARVMAARRARPTEVDAALVAIADASQAACHATGLRDDALAATGLLGALRLGAYALDQLARATGVELVPPRVAAVRHPLERLGGTAKTTGAGGGDIAIAVISASIDVSEVTRIIIESGCQLVRSIVDERGVDLILDAE